MFTASARGSQGLIDDHRGIFRCEWRFSALDLSVMPDPTALALFGLPGLFAVAFLAGSVIPIPSEAMMIALLVGGTAPIPTVAVATVGNFLGAVTLFWIGRRLLGEATGGRLTRWIERAARVDPARLERSMGSLRRWGAPALLLSWIPLVGDLLVLAAGAVGVRGLPFAIYTGIGKTVRFGVVALAALAATA